MSSRPRPWESEDAAFRFLLRVAVVAAALVAVVLLLRLVF